MAFSKVARETGEVYGDYLKEQLDAQDAYKKSLEDRAISVITTSSTVAALLFAFSAFLKSGSTVVTLNPTALVALSASLVLFAAAAAAAVLVNKPRDYEGPVADEIKKLLNDSWSSEESPASAAYRIAGTRVTVFKSAKLQNQVKARYLIWSIALEFLAIAGLAIGVVAAFVNS